MGNEDSNTGKLLSANMYNEFEDIFQTLKDIVYYTERNYDEKYRRKKIYDLQSDLKREIEKIKPKIDEVHDFLFIVNDFIKEMSQILSSYEADLVLKSTKNALKYEQRIKNLDFSRLGEKIFEIPKEISDETIRSDLEEAIKDYENQCYTSAMAMCSAAYEVTIDLLYFKIKKKRPDPDKVIDEFDKIISEKDFDVEKKKQIIINRGKLVKTFRNISVHARSNYNPNKGDTMPVILDTIQLLKDLFIEFPELREDTK